MSDHSSCDPRAHLNGTANSAAIVPHFELREIPAAQVDEYWPRMLPEIKGIIERSPEVCDFLPEEVYVCLRRKVAFLHVVLIDGEYAGFGILQLKQMPFSQERYILVWIGGALKTEAVEPFYTELDNIARRLQVRRLQQIGRAGWMRKSPAGWKTAAVILEKYLE